MQRGLSLSCNTIPCFFENWAHRQSPNTWHIWHQATKHPFQHFFSLYSYRYILYHILEMRLTLNVTYCFHKVVRWVVRRNVKSMKTTEAAALWFKLVNEFQLINTTCQTRRSNSRWHVHVQYNLYIILCHHLELRNCHI